MPPALVRRNSHSLVKAPPPPSDKRRVVSQAPASSAARRIRDDDEGAAADAGASSARPPRRVLVQRAVAGFARSADGMQITRLHGAAGSAPGPPRLSVDFKRRCSPVHASGHSPWPAHAARTLLSHHARCPGPLPAFKTLPALARLTARARPAPCAQAREGPARGRAARGAGARAVLLLLQDRLLQPHRGRVWKLPCASPC